jgi:hypothetical protein
VPPHLEGGTHVNCKMYDRLSPLGEAVLEKYFSANGAWLLPQGSSGCGGQACAILYARGRHLWLSGRQRAHGTYRFGGTSA